ncbi:hypothetical protein SUGI_0835280 [Cryptomeria japonica]|nr:hypothetical protein SUGI_0835280 [Cryptomeria japonica]
MAVASLFLLTNYLGCHPLSCSFLVSIFCSISTFSSTYFHSNESPSVVAARSPSMATILFLQLEALSSDLHSSSTFGLPGFYCCLKQLRTILRHPQLPANTIDRALIPLFGMGGAENKQSKTNMKIFI